jgi:hypothetical protein
MGFEARAEYQPPAIVVRTPVAGSIVPKPEGLEQPEPQ